MTKNKTFVSDKDTRINAYTALRARQTKKWQSELKFDFTFDNMRNAQDALTLAFWKGEIKIGILGRWIAFGIM